MRSLRGAPVDAILIQQRTETQATSVLNSYLESPWHTNGAAGAEGPTCVLPRVPMCPAAGGAPCEGWGCAVGQRARHGLGLHQAATGTQKQGGQGMAWLLISLGCCKC